jgi:hypothetical protein
MLIPSVITALSAAGILRKFGVREGRMQQFVRELEALVLLNACATNFLEAQDVEAG